VSQLFEGKVVFITGAARGQGRAHAVRFAEEGADVIAFDLCDQIDSVGYPMATPEDLDETVNLVEKTGTRIVAEQGDVRDLDQLKAAVANGVAVGQQPLMDIPPVELGYVSDAMVYLCGPSGRYLTGITLPVDGGLNLR